MALKFYINSIADTNQINVQTNSAVTENIGTFDNGVLPLEWNDNPHAILPNAKLFIVDTSNNDTWCFIVIADDVSVVKKGSNTIYQHNLTISQNTNELTKHIIRNHIFSQPANRKIVGIYNNTFGTGSIRLFEPPTEVWKKKRPEINAVLNSRMKLTGNPIVKISTQSVKFQNSSIETQTTSTSIRSTKSSRRATPIWRPASERAA